MTKVLIGFAVGALLGILHLIILGDAFIHLIPEAFNTSEVDHEHRRILEDQTTIIGNDTDDSEAD